MEVSATPPDAAAPHPGMVELMLRLAPAEGYTATRVPGIRLLRSNRPLQSTPVLYEPGVVFVCQGRKKGLWGDRLLVYDARHYLAVAVPVPFTMETEASADEPLLAIYLSLDLALVAELTARLDGLLGPPAAAPVTMLSSPIDGALPDCLLRLLGVLGSPVDAAILGPSIVREICFRVLCGAQGPALRAALAGTGHVARIGRAVQKIHSAYFEDLEVEVLAREAGMGVSAFHARFKEVTHTSPLQYLKSIRLHKARLLMLRENATAAAVALRVGYESPSQFSREFSRLFGRSPGAEVARLRSAYALPAMPWKEAWVSSH